MLKQLSYKQKLIMLLIGFVVAIIIVYSVALSETFELKRKCKSIEAKLNNIATAPSQIKQIESKLSKINKVLGETYSDEIDQQEVLLEQVSKYCNRNNIILKEFPQKHQITLNEYVIETYMVTIEGSFIKLLKLLYNLETNFTQGKVNSVHFNTYTDFKLRRSVLQASIYIQNIKNKSNEAKADN